MKKYICIIMMCLACLTATAQQTSSDKKIIQRITQTAAAMKSMQCDFVQTRYTKMLGEKVISKGKMSYTKPNTLRWEYTSPNVFILSMKGNAVTVQKMEGGKIVNAQSNKYVKRLASFILSAVTGQSLNDAKMFKTTAQDNGKDYIITLVPLKKEMKQMYPKMQLTFSKKSEIASRVIMYERNGDYTDIEFTKR
ncbi:MAG: outer membrane lipoprotein carrier protein LolA [Prevotella sp.]|nr:outer membrane lipoprotein carrier protein LolA [Candidatus Prevotella equi]